MIKIKINDKHEYISVKKSYKNYSTLEFIALLDLTIDSLKNNFELSDNDIWKLLKKYRKNIKEVK